MVVFGGPRSGELLPVMIGQLLRVLGGLDAMDVRSTDDTNLLSQWRKQCAERSADGAKGHRDKASLYRVSLADGEV